MLKIDFENQILALFDGYFWPFNKSHEKIKCIFVISAIIPSIWNVFIKFGWRDEKLTVDSIVDGNFPYCGGTIIGPSTILTAAHCLYEVTNISGVKILVAEHDLKISDETKRR